MFIQALEVLLMKPPKELRKAKSQELDICMVQLEPIRDFQPPYILSCLPCLSLLKLARCSAFLASAISS